MSNERNEFERWFTTGQHGLRFDERMAAREAWEAALAFRQTEIGRLEACLKAANDMAEKFERWHYLDLHEYEMLFKAATRLSNYAWSAVSADCKEATDYLNTLLARLRKELSRRGDADDQARIGEARCIEDCAED